MVNGAETVDKSASKAERHEARLKRQAARSEKPGGRPARLCVLSTVEVKKSEQGFQIVINGSERRRHFTLTPDETGPVLRDLEIAIQVIRAQQ